MKTSADQTPNDAERFESTLSRIVDGLPAFFSLLTPNGEIEYANRHFLEYFGMTLEELNREGGIECLFRTVHADDRQGVLSTWRESFETGHPYNFECRRRRADGAYRWLHSRGFPLRDSSGRIVLWYVLQIDIDDRKRVEARKAAILDSALDCIVTMDHEGCITEFNPAAERTFRFNRDEVIGKPLGDVIVPPAFREQHRRGFARYLATGEAHVLGKRIEMSAVRADGSEFPVELAITRIPMEGPPSFTGYLRDISDRKRAEEELRRSAAYLAEAQKLSKTGSFGWNVDTDDHFWSDETFRIFEYDASTRITIQSILARVHPQDVHLMARAKELAAQGAHFDYECRLLMPGGSVKYVHIVAHAVDGQSGKHEYVGAVMDITATRLAEDALRRGQAELAHVSRLTTLGELTASIAHEVNQPLGAIINNAGACLGLLPGDSPQLDEVRDALAEIIEGANRASTIITRVRELSKKSLSAHIPVNLSELATSVLALARYEIFTRQVQIRTNLTDDLPPVYGDRVQLQQVLLNLVINGMDAMSTIDVSKRALCISVRRNRQGAEPGCLIGVEDAGIGLKPENADRLFEAFFTTKSEGMGMGLAISRSIIEAHGGRLWAETNQGPGATFLFHLPQARTTES